MIEEVLWRTRKYALFSVMQNIRLDKWVRLGARFIHVSCADDKEWSLLSHHIIHVHIIEMGSMSDWENQGRNSGRHMTTDWSVVVTSLALECFIFCRRSHGLSEFLITYSDRARMSDHAERWYIFPFILANLIAQMLCDDLSNCPIWEKTETLYGKRYWNRTRSLGIVIEVIPQ